MPVQKERQRVRFEKPLKEIPKGNPFGSQGVFLEQRSGTEKNAIVSYGV